MIRSGVMPSSSSRFRQPAWYVPREAPPPRMNAVRRFFVRGLAAISERSQRPQPARRLCAVAERAEGSSCELVLDGLRAARVAEAVAVPVDGRLDRVLMRRRPPAEVALRLRVPVGPPLAREPHL